MSGNNYLDLLFDTERLGKISLLSYFITFFREGESYFLGFLKEDLFYFSKKIFERIFVLLYFSNPVVLFLADICNPPASFPCLFG